MTHSGVVALFLFSTSMPSYHPFVAMPKDGFEWTGDLIEAFIPEFCEHECVWNTKCKDYKNNVKKELAWKTIAEDLDIPGRTGRLHFNQMPFLKTLCHSFARL